MAKIDQYFFDINRLDILARGESRIHRLDPRAKLITTLIFMTMVVSFNKYTISALIPFVVFPVVLAAGANLPAGFILKKMLMVAPFAVLIGLFNPLIDRGILLHLGPIGISGGWVSFTSILIRFALTVGTALIFIAVTGFNEFCLALQKLRVPMIFVVQLLFLYRYLFVLVDEAARMVQARSLRTVNSGGQGLKVFGSMVGHLLLRSMDRAQRIHLAMRCRAFDGRITIIRPLDIGVNEIVFVLGWTALFVLMRMYNVPGIIGMETMGIM